MTTHFANSTLSFSGARAETAATSRKQGALMRAAQWLLDMPRRRAVINELDSLSDHELADIGLSRGDVPNVFQPGFVAERMQG